MTRLPFRKLRLVQVVLLLFLLHLSFDWFEQVLPLYWHVKHMPGVPLQRQHLAKRVESKDTNVSSAISDLERFQHIRTMAPEYQVAQSDIKNCSAASRFAFVKVHKCGSDSLSSLFMRIAEENQLELLLPKTHKWNLQWPYKPVIQDAFRPSRKLSRR